MKILLQSSATHLSMFTLAFDTSYTKPLYIRVELKREKVEIQEFFDSLVITYENGAVDTYACTHERSQVA